SRPPLRATIGVTPGKGPETARRIGLETHTHQPAQPCHGDRHCGEIGQEGSASCTTVARMRKIVAGVLGALMALTAASCGSSGTTAKKTTTTKAPSTARVGTLKGKTAAEILKAATAAATKAGSAHYVLSAVEGTSSQTISGDSSMTDGQQTVEQGA